MNQSPYLLYFFTFIAALVMSLILTPAARAAALVLKIIDHPHTDVKTHTEPVPYLGGVSIFLAFTFSLLWIRVLTSFPTGTLRSLRGVILGGLFIFALGLVDDIKHRGLHYRHKFIFQLAAGMMIMMFGIQIKFINPNWLAWVITMAWIVGITNALNLVDIMDGLAAGVAFVAALAFLFISLPTEEIYVNFSAAALAGATLGFLPFNLSRKMRIFMGDSGSLFLGFILGTLALGTSYGDTTELGVFAPLMILALPIYDTLLVFILRIQKGISPFLGSKDHFPLRLEIRGWSRPQIISFALGTAFLFSAGAFMITRSNTTTALLIYSIWIIYLISLSFYITRVRVK